ncbi:polymorphic toxin-type HINT domain-containing protein [Micromonospora sp. LOL_023]|uniref:polymorphic toxin-type HINT domain-containing protein n=1 Tax=Micromonospora sp. LOL_023 TaxID=3345418 RepID=UPI003A8C849C
MADGTTRPIVDVNVGDQVVATDPVSGTSSPKPVTQLHRNTDRELTDVRVRTSDNHNRDGGGATVVVETTPNHPFWNEDRQAWVNAGDLTPGTRLRVAGRGEVTVVSVETRRDEREMRDLTVADTHTYHVLAGDTPVLVHNCNNAVLGINEHGEKLASHLRGEGLSNVRTFNDPGLKPVDPESGMAGWQMAVKDAIRDEDTTIHVALDGMDGATHSERFMNAYNAGRGGNFGATDWEMAQLGLAVRREVRTWSSIKFYHADARVYLAKPNW